MAEICDDIKVNLIEAVGNLGITLSSENTRINHTETGLLDMTSNGVINISTGNSDIYAQGYNLLGNINIGSKDATAETAELAESVTINIIGGRGTADVEGGGILIQGGNGGENLNSNGGSITVISGEGRGTGDGGNLYIKSGLGRLGDGGDIYIEAGISDRTGLGGQNGGDIRIQSGNGGTKCGDVVVSLGPSIDNQIPFFGPTGKFKVNYGAFRLAVFNDIAKREDRIPIPEKGDMCFVNDKIHVFNGTAWRTLAFEP